MRHDDEIQGVMFSPDGSQLATRAWKYRQPVGHMNLQADEPNG